MLLPFTVNDAGGLLPPDPGGSFSSRIRDDGPSGAQYGSISVRGQRLLHRPADAHFGAIQASVSGKGRGPIVERHHRLDRSGLDRLVSLDPVRCGWRYGGGTFGQQANEALTGKLPVPLGCRALCFCVREPFTSKTSAADITFGRLDRGEDLVVTSQMPRNGIVFSDGIEADSLDFVSGGVLRVGVADKTLQLITGLAYRRGDERVVASGKVRAWNPPATKDLPHQFGRRR